MTYEIEFYREGAKVKALPCVAATPKEAADIAYESLRAHGADFARIMDRGVEVESVLGASRA